MQLREQGVMKSAAAANKATQATKERKERREKESRKKDGVIPKKEENKKSKRMGRVAGQEALKYSEDFDMYSKLQRRTRKRRVITQLRWSDLKIGKLLGEGNFSHVYEVQLRKRAEPLPDDVETVVTEDLKNGINSFNVANDNWNDEVSILTEEDQQLDVWELISTTSDHDVEDSSDEENEVATYALKHLHPQMTEKQRDFTAGAIDLVLEAKILACLDHPNIVKLYGVTKGTISNVFSGNGYFLLLDRLHGTLEDKIQDWIATEMTNNAKRRAMMTGRDSDQSQDPNTIAVQSYRDKVKLVEERLRTVALDVARGMEYLHQHRIVFRDLKPSNVGFTAKGTVRIFDFGLAKEIIDSRQRLTGNTGSLRYMAPEVNRREHYGFPADVYSFGIMLWEMCCLKKPFKGMTKEEHSSLVIHKGYRPKINAVPGSDDLKKVIQACWSADPKERPSYRAVRRFLNADAKNKEVLPDREPESPQRRPSTTSRLIMRLRRQNRNIANNGTYKKTPTAPVPNGKKGNLSSFIARGR